MSKPSNYIFNTYIHTSIHRKKVNRDENFSGKSVETENETQYPNHIVFFNASPNKSFPSHFLGNQTEQKQKVKTTINSL